MKFTRPTGVIYHLVNLLILYGFLSSLLARDWNSCIWEGILVGIVVFLYGRDLLKNIRNRHIAEDRIIRDPAQLAALAAT